jgi:hypothetical protein
MATVSNSPSKSQYILEHGETESLGIKNKTGTDEA